jgi:hypothetical protein
MQQSAQRKARANQPNTASTPMPQCAFFIENKIKGEGRQGGAQKLANAEEEREAKNIEILYKLAYNPYNVSLPAKTYYSEYKGLPLDNVSYEMGHSSLYNK